MAEINKGPDEWNLFYDNWDLFREMVSYFRKRKTDKQNHDLQRFISEAPAFAYGNSHKQEQEIRCGVSFSFTPIQLIRTCIFKNKN